MNRTDDDGAETIALARLMGVAGVAGGETTEEIRAAERRLIADTPGSGADDILDLATAVGLSGLQPRVAAVEPDQAAAAPMSAPEGAGDGSDTVALARRIGLSGIRPRSTSIVQIPQAANDPIAIASQAIGQVSGATANETGAAHEQGKCETFVTVSIVGTAGLNLLAEWENKNGAIGEPSERGGQAWLERREGSFMTRAYSLPAGSKPAQDLAYLRGGLPIDPTTRLVVVGLQELDVSEFKMRGPRVRGSASSGTPLGVPSTLSPSAIQILSDLAGR